MVLPYRHFHADFHNKRKKIHAHTVCSYQAAFKYYRRGYSKKKRERSDTRTQSEFPSRFTFVNLSKPSSSRYRLYHYAKTRKEQSNHEI